MCLSGPSVFKVITVRSVIKNVSRLTSLIFIESSVGELIATAWFSACGVSCCTALGCVSMPKLHVSYFISNAFPTCRILGGMHICARAGTLWDCVHLITYPGYLLVYHYVFAHTPHHTHLPFNHVLTAGD